MRRKVGGAIRNKKCKWIILLILLSFTAAGCTDKALLNEQQENEIELENIKLELEQRQNELAGIEEEIRDRQSELERLNQLIDNAGENVVQNGREFDEDFFNKINTGDLSQLFDAYYSRIDGAYAEGYGYRLYQLYKEYGADDFLEALKKTDRYKIGGIIYLLAGELFMGCDIKEINEFEEYYLELSKKEDLTGIEKFIVHRILADVNYLKVANDFN